ncbi:hypothetical protein HELRODRAFT_169116 [Helobdella robusta]|uniref:ISXO2-like transposase domain-containing protein n=1 Tax=Helobdella robusta TaxID=6412 RepID=T1F1F2_HELRO|nr:hypothetical protein HELRODRAFT_169116 [Helobdella robusta]ESO08311.1 hypothetical protein HELRODRAFT_169116 [Helobdella robusta]
MAAYPSVDRLYFKERRCCEVGQTAWFDSGHDDMPLSCRHEMVTCGGVETPGAALQKQLGMKVSTAIANHPLQIVFWTHWVFGGIDTQTKDAFLVEVNKQDAATLLQLIQGHVLPGTTVWTDQWAAYHSITAVPGLAHKTVYHSITFRAVNGVHTNGVENLWRCAKQKFQENEWKRGFILIYQNIYSDVQK